MKRVVVAAVLVFIGCAPKPQPVPELTDSWRVLAGTYSGSPMDIRFNQGMQPAVAHPSYPDQVTITALMTESTPEGLATPEEDSLLKILENRITGQLSKDRLCLLVAVVTTGGTRDFIFYSTSAEEVRKLLPQLQNSAGNHELKLSAISDKRWGVYNQFRNPQ